MTYLNVVSPLAYDQSTGRITGVVDAQGTEHALCNLDESETAALRASGLTSSEATLNAAVQPRSGTLASLVELAGLPGEWAYPTDRPKTAVRFTGVAGGAETWQAGSGWQVFSDSDESHPWCIVSPYATLGDQSFGQTVIGVGIVNDAYRYSVVAIGDSVEVMGSGSVGIGSYSSAYDFGVAIGVAAKALTSSVAIGTNVSSLNENEVCVGVPKGSGLNTVRLG